MMLTDYPDRSSSNLGNRPLPPLPMQACKQTGNLDFDHVLYWSLLLENIWSPNTTGNPFLALRKRLTNLYTVPAFSLHRQTEFKPHKAHD